jgi:TRAP-type uncharacterized transport system substrate-binding protein
VVDHDPWASGAVNVETFGMLKGLSAPRHPGAERYFKEVGRLQ